MSCVAAVLNTLAIWNKSTSFLLFTRIQIRSSHWLCDWSLVALFIQCVGGSHKFLCGVINGSWVKL